MRTIVLIGCVKMQTRGEGVQNPENFANLINGCAPSSSCYVNENPAPLPLNFWLLVKEHFLKLVKPLCH